MMMQAPSSWKRWCTAFVLTGMAAMAEADRLVPVSPGGRGDVTPEAGACPTFTWASESAERAEIAVWRLAGDPAEDEGAEQRGPLALRRQLPAGARVWTPDLADCLPADGRYAWSVRPVGDESWSEPRRFTVPAEAISAQSVRNVLEAVGFPSPRLGGVGDRLEPANARPADDLTPAGEPAVAQATDAEGLAVSDQVSSSRARTSVVADVTSLFADAPATTGVTYGVYGASESSEQASAGLIGQSLAASGATFGVFGKVASPDGIAGVFDTTGGGDAIRGLNGSGQVFSVASDGSITAVDFAGDGSQLLPPVAGLDCLVPCVNGIEIVDESIDGSRLQPDSVTSRVIFDSVSGGAAGQSEIATDAVGTSELAAGSVDQSAFGLRSIEAVDIQANAVGSDEIATNAVETSDLADDAVTRSKIKGTEIQLYQVHGDCAGAGRGTLSSTCFSIQGSCPLGQFKNCSGGCTGTPQECSNTFEGYLLGLDF